MRKTIYLLIFSCLSICSFAQLRPGYSIKNDTLTGEGIETSTPNPFNTELNVTINVRQAGPATVEVVDLLGKQQYSSAETLDAGSNKIVINTNGLSNGIYFVRVSQHGETFTQKVVKK